MKASLKILSMVLAGAGAAAALLIFNDLVSGDDAIMILAFAVVYSSIGVLFATGAARPLVSISLISLPMVGLLAVLTGVDAVTFPLFSLTTIAFTTAGLFLRRFWTRISRVTLSAVSASSVTYVWVVGFFLLPRLSGTQVVSEMNQPAPAFEFADLKGGTIASTDLKGKVVLLNFWATWCSNCRKEMPDFNELSKSYQGNDQVVILAVDIADTLGESNAKAAAFMEKNGYDLNLAFDKGFRTGLIMKLQNIPAAVLIDKKGQMRMTHTGFGGEHDFKTLMHDEIEKLLRE